jgi:hypothetical protein
MLDHVPYRGGNNSTLIAMLAEAKPSPPRLRAAVPVHRGLASTTPRISPFSDGVALRRSSSRERHAALDDDLILPKARRSRTRSTARRNVSTWRRARLAYIASACELHARIAFLLARRRARLRAAKRAPSTNADSECRLQWQGDRVRKFAHSSSRTVGF